MTTTFSIIFDKKKKKVVLKLADSKILSADRRGTQRRSSGAEERENDGEQELRRTRTASRNNRLRTSSSAQDVNRHFFYYNGFVLPHWKEVEPHRPSFLESMELWVWVLVSVGEVVINSVTRLAEHLRSRQEIGKSGILCQFDSWDPPVHSPAQTQHKKATLATNSDLKCRLTATVKQQLSTEPTTAPHRRFLQTDSKEERERESPLNHWANLQKRSICHVTYINSHDQEDFKETGSTQESLYQHGFSHNDSGPAITLAVCQPLPDIHQHRRLITQQHTALILTLNLWAVHCAVQHYHSSPSHIHWML
ncbi:hypothetical protein DPX16_5960 [Anabarilius grahami]|uniref:Uncharacterized protein n=1 Tax=Anabarilius grahami TaxID=495550 RepID=A0A3N0Y357_ANAGA|nr:hypothetical protein DPX16_5960 [Anabarilius grahami]